MSIPLRYMLCTFPQEGTGVRAPYVTAGCEGHELTVTMNFRAPAS